MRRSLLISLAVCACTGQVVTPAPSSLLDPSGSGGGSTQVAPCVPGAVAATAMPRLSRAQYDNLAADLLLATYQPSSVLGTDEKVGPFASNSVTLMSRSLAEQYQFAAEKLADDAVKTLDRVAPCANPGTDAAACAATFIDGFGRRAFRRPLTDDEKTRYRQLYADANEGSYGEGMRAVLEAMLQSPSFVYRVETLPQGASPDTTAAWALSGFEKAARLSFFLWNTGPDDALLDAAAAGQLDSVEGLKARADAMLTDARAVRGIGTFTDAWAGLDAVSAAAALPAGARGLDPALLGLMQRETRSFVSTALLGQNAFATLLTADWTTADPRVATELYGATTAPAADGHLALDRATRSGLLTQPSVLFSYAHSEQSSPVLRGKWVREVLLCQKVPDPPANVNATPPDPMPGQSTRERFAQHRNDAACAGCHVLLDDIGFAFEGFDQTGRSREKDGDQPVNVEGKLVQTDVDGTFIGVRALGEKLAQSDVAASCFAQQWFRFGTGRNPGAGEACVVQEMASDLTGEAGYAGLVHRLVSSDSFSQRKSP